MYRACLQVLPTSHQTALIEVLPNSVSVHSIKRCLPPETSLADHFFRLFPKGTASCERAQAAFAQSLAAYSLVCYILQIKDRHNANILMDTEVQLSACFCAPAVSAFIAGCALVGSLTVRDERCSSAHRLSCCSSKHHSPDRPVQDKR
jgi:hypothetical protein